MVANLIFLFPLHLLDPKDYQSNKMIIYLAAVIAYDLCFELQCEVGIK